MNKPLLAIALAGSVFSCGSAMAGTPVVSWHGYYAGGNAGAAITDADARTSVSGLDYFATSSMTSINNNGGADLGDIGFTGGAQIGYNHQVNEFVFGFETDFGYFGTDESESVTVVYPDYSPYTYTLKQSASTDWLFTARPRVGWTTDNFLIYATGGLAITNVKYTENFSDNYDVYDVTHAHSKSQIMPGWTVGAGAEYALMGKWSLKGEYLYADFGSFSTKSNNMVDASARAYSSTVFRNSLDLTSHILRTGFNYRF